MGDIAPTLLRVCRLGSSFDEGKVFSVSWVARSFSWQLDVLYIPLFFHYFSLPSCYVRLSRPSVPIFSFLFFHSFIRARWEKLFWRYHSFFVMAEVCFFFFFLRWCQFDR